MYVCCCVLWMQHHVCKLQYGRAWGSKVLESGTLTLSCESPNSFVLPDSLAVADLKIL